METQTQQGMAAMRRGDKLAAQEFLHAAVRSDPNDINAWLWLSGAVDTDEQRLHCLQQVLKIDPENAMAGKGIALLISRGAVTLQVVPVKEQLIGSSNDVLLPRESKQKSDSRVVPNTSKASQPLPTQATKIKQQPLTVNQRASDDVIFNTSPSTLPIFLRGGILLILLAFLGLLFRTSTPYIVYGIFGLAIYGTAVIILRLIQRSYTSYTLTRSKLIVQGGIFNRNKKVLPVTKIQDVSYRQPILDRIFGLGDVVVESAGERGAVNLVDVRRCVELSEEILKVVQIKQ